MHFGVRGPILLLGIAAGLGGSPGATPATESWQDPAPSPSPSKTSSAPSPSQPAGSLPIDQLLKLPASYRANDVRKGGATRLEWRARFDEARTDLDEKEKELARVRAEMAAAAGEVSQWQVAPPGADLRNADNPTSFRLTQELRHGREFVELAEKRLMELDIEANLADVPEDWRL